VLAQNIELYAVGPPIFVGFSASGGSDGTLAGEWALARALSMVRNRVGRDVNGLNRTPNLALCLIFLSFGR
jgi:hypothetical protein